MLATINRTAQVENRMMESKRRYWYLSQDRKLILLQIVNG